MSVPYKIFLTALAAGIPSFFLGKIIWPISSDLGVPAVTEFPMISMLSFFEALLFGLGVSFVIYGWNILKKLPSKLTKIMLYVSIAWLLLSWWPHDSLHLSVGNNIRNQLMLEFIFHIPTMLAQICLVYALIALLQSILQYNSQREQALK